MLEKMTYKCLAVISACIALMMSAILIVATFIGNQFAFSLSLAILVVSNASATPLMNSIFGKMTFHFVTGSIFFLAIFVTFLLISFFVRFCLEFYLAKKNKPQNVINIKID